MPFSLSVNKIWWYVEWLHFKTWNFCRFSYLNYMNCPSCAPQFHSCVIRMKSTSTNSGTHTYGRVHCNWKKCPHFQAERNYNLHYECNSCPRYSTLCENWTPTHLCFLWIYFWREEKKLIQKCTPFGCRVSNVRRQESGRLTYSETTSENTQGKMPFFFFCFFSKTPDFNCAISNSHFGICVNANRATNLHRIHFHQTRVIRAKEIKIKLRKERTKK